jgi:hypothetical protein
VDATEIESSCSFGLEQETPEEQDAQNNEDRNDDDLDETHGLFFPNREVYQAGF